MKKQTLATIKKNLESAVLPYKVTRINRRKQFTVLKFYHLGKLVLESLGIKVLKKGMDRKENLIKCKEVGKKLTSLLKERNLITENSEAVYSYNYITSVSIRIPYSDFINKKLKRGATKKPKAKKVHELHLTIVGEGTNKKVLERYADALCDKVNRGITPINLNSDSIQYVWARYRIE